MIFEHLNFKKNIYLKKIMTNTLTNKITETYISAYISTKHTYQQNAKSIFPKYFYSTSNKFQFCSIIVFISELLLFWSYLYFVCIALKIIFILNFLVNSPVHLLEQILRLLVSRVLFLSKFLV